MTIRAIVRLTLGGVLLALVLSGGMVPQLGADWYWLAIKAFVLSFSAAVLVGLVYGLAGALAFRGRK